MTSVYIALALFAPAVVACVVSLGARRGAVASMLGGWLLLPAFDVIGSRIPVLHSKNAFVSTVVCLVTVLYDWRTWSRLRLRLADLPVMALCTLPAFTALANDLGPGEAASAVLETTLVWGTPYLLGRVYLADPGALRAFAAALATAALVYAPLCLWEVRMSPHLHEMVYGFRPFGSDFTQVIRFGGFRPSVFMADGLMLAMFLAVATLCAYWLWRTKAAPVLARMPAGWAVLALVFTTLSTKSTGAVALLGFGVLGLEVAARLKTLVVFLVLLAVPPAYCASRIMGWSGEDAVQLAARVVNQERAESIRFRMDNEDMLVKKAMQRPALGWGRFGRARIYDVHGRDIAITDGFWVIYLGGNGVVGLTVVWLLLVVPFLGLRRRFATRLWSDPRLAAPVALVVALLLFAVDDLLNSMLMPIYPAAAGGVMSFLLAAGAARARSGRRSAIAAPARPATSR
jgi:hypothetical protein